MTTVQLIGVAAGVATVQRDSMSPVEMTWGLLHEAQQEDSPAGYVYRWLMSEYCRCEYEQCNGRPWTSPRRYVADIVSDFQCQDAAEARQRATRERENAERKEREARQTFRRADDDRIESERRQLATDDPWFPIPVREVPGNIRFDTPRQNQGQIVEVAYGTSGRSEAGPADPYMLVMDHSMAHYEVGACRAYKRRDV